MHQTPRVAPADGERARAALMTLGAIGTWSRSLCRRQSLPQHDFDIPSARNWVEEAAASLQLNGCVVLRPADVPLIPPELIDRCRREVRPLLDHWLGVADRCGMADESALKFQELYSRAQWEHRFDIMVQHRPTVERADVGLPWSSLLAAVDAIVRPILYATGVFGHGAEAEVEAVGAVLSLCEQKIEPASTAASTIHKSIHKHHP